MDSDLYVSPKEREEDIRGNENHDSVRESKKIQAAVKGQEGLNLYKCQYLNKFSVHHKTGKVISICLKKHIEQIASIPVTFAQ